eukprot:Nk52_evm22s32 gene=Nk52_evmTU22s32
MTFPVENNNSNTHPSVCFTATGSVPHGNKDASGTNTGAGNKNNTTAASDNSNSNSTSDNNSATSSTRIGSLAISNQANAPTGASLVLSSSSSSGAVALVTSSSSGSSNGSSTLSSCSAAAPGIAKSGMVHPAGGNSITETGGDVRVLVEGRGGSGHSMTGVKAGDNNKGQAGVVTGNCGAGVSSSSSASVAVTGVEEVVDRSGMGEQRQVMQGQGREVPMSARGSMVKEACRHMTGDGSLGGGAGNGLENFNDASHGGRLAHVGGGGSMSNASRHTQWQVHNTHEYQMPPQFSQHAPGAIMSGSGAREQIHPQYHMQQQYQHNHHHHCSGHGNTPQHETTQQQDEPFVGQAPSHVQVESVSSLRPHPSSHGVQPYTPSGNNGGGFNQQQYMCSQSAATEHLRSHQHVSQQHGRTNQHQPAQHAYAEGGTVSFRNQGVLQSDYQNSNARGHGATHHHYEYGEHRTEVSNLTQRQGVHPQVQRGQSTNQLHQHQSYQQGSHQAPLNQTGGHKRKTSGIDSNVIQHRIRASESPGHRDPSTALNTGPQTGRSPGTNVKTAASLTSSTGPRSNLPRGYHTSKAGMPNVAEHQGNDNRRAHIAQPSQGAEELQMQTMHARQHPNSVAGNPSHSDSGVRQNSNIKMQDIVHFQNDYSLNGPARRNIPNQHISMSYEHSEDLNNAESRRASQSLSDYGAAQQSSVGGSSDDRTQRTQYTGDMRASSNGPAGSTGLEKVPFRDQRRGPTEMHTAHHLSQQQISHRHNLQSQQQRMDMHATNASLLASNAPLEVNAAAGGIVQSHSEPIYYRHIQDGARIAGGNSFANVQSGVTYSHQQLQSELQGVGINGHQGRPSQQMYHVANESKARSGGQGLPYVEYGMDNVQSGGQRNGVGYHTAQASHFDGPGGMNRNMLAQTSSTMRGPNQSENVTHQGRPASGLIQKGNPGGGGRYRQQHLPTISQSTSQVANQSLHYKTGSAFQPTQRNYSSANQKLTSTYMKRLSASPSSCSSSSTAHPHSQASNRNSIPNQRNATGTAPKGSFGRSTNSFAPHSQPHSSNKCGGISDAKEGSRPANEQRGPTCVPVKVITSSEQCDTSVSPSAPRRFQNDQGYSEKKGQEGAVVSTQNHPVGAGDVGGMVGSAGGGNSSGVVASASATSSVVKTKKPCSCKNSKCVKLYCECFASGEYCDESCKCKECKNLPEFDNLRKIAIDQTLVRKPNAFKAKISSSGVTDSTTNTILSQHNKGCNCKKSGCLKKYCECYQAGIVCSDKCKCVDCKNNIEWRFRHTSKTNDSTANVNPANNSAMKTQKAQRSVSQSISPQKLQFSNSNTRSDVGSHVGTIGTTSSVNVGEERSKQIASLHSSSGVVQAMIHGHPLPRPSSNDRVDPNTLGTRGHVATAQSFPTSSPDTAAGHRRRVSASDDGDQFVQRHAKRGRSMSVTSDAPSDGRFRKASSVGAYDNRQNPPASLTSSSVRGQGNTSNVMKPVALGMENGMLNSKGITLIRGGASLPGPNSMIPIGSVKSAFNGNGKVFKIGGSGKQTIDFGVTGKQEGSLRGRSQSSSFGSFAGENLGARVDEPVATIISNRPASMPPTTTSFVEKVGGRIKTPGKVQQNNNGDYPIQHRLSPQGVQPQHLQFQSVSQGRVSQSHRSTRLPSVGAENVPEAATSSPSEAHMNVESAVSEVQGPVLTVDSITNVCSNLIESVYNHHVELKKAEDDLKRRSKRGYGDGDNLKCNEREILSPIDEALEMPAKERRSEYYLSHEKKILSEMEGHLKEILALSRKRNRWGCS